MLSPSRGPDGGLLLSAGIAGIGWMWVSPYFIRGRREREGGGVKLREGVLLDGTWGDG